MADDVTFTINAVDKASAAMSGIRGAMLSLNQAAQLAGQVYAGVNKIIDQTIGKYIQYADQVRTLSKLTNQSAEDTSRLIQVSDDYKLSVENLTVASKTLATKGFSLNVETIAKLSDEYLKLNTGAERQTFLTKNLGRASAEWTEILTQGSTAIMARNGMVERNLILSQSQLIKAREYEIAQDNLNDAWMAASVAVGEKVVPPLIKLLNTYTETLNISDLYQRGQKAGLALTMDFWNGQVKLNGAFVTYEELLKAVGARTDDLNESTGGFIQYASAIGPGLEPVNAAADTLVKSIDSIASSWQAVGWSALVASAELDGVITYEEISQLTQYGVALGIMTAAEAAAKVEAYNAATAFRSIPSDWPLALQAWAMMQNAHTLAPGGPALSLGGGGTGGGAGGNTLKPGHWVPDDNNPGHYKWENYALGGPLPLGRKFAEVGEQGTEGITPAGVVIPHGPWEQMKQRGLVPGSHHGGGGLLGNKYNQDDPYSRYDTPRLTQPSVLWTGGEGANFYPGEGNGNFGNYGGFSPSAQVASAAMSVSAAASTISVSGEKTAQATQQSAAMNNAGNAAIISKLNSIDLHLQQLPRDLQAAVAKIIPT